MKKLPLLFAFLLLALLSVPTQAAEIESAPSNAPLPVEVPSDVVTSETTVDDKNITVNVVMPGVEAPAPFAPVDKSAVAPIEEVFLPPDAVVRTTTKLLDESPLAADASLSSVVQTLFGTYTPRTQTVTETASDGSSVTYTEYVPGLAGLDWYWLSGVALFGLCLLSFFKLLGGVVKRG